MNQSLGWCHWQRTSPSPAAGGLKCQSPSCESGWGKTGCIWRVRPLSWHERNFLLGALYFHSCCCFRSQADPLSQTAHSVFLSYSFLSSFFFDALDAINIFLSNSKTTTTTTTKNKALSHLFFFDFFSFYEIPFNVTPGPGCLQYMHLKVQFRYFFPPWVLTFALFTLLVHFISISVLGDDIFPSPWVGYVVLLAGHSRLRQWAFENLPPRFSWFYAVSCVLWLIQQEKGNLNSKW